MPSKDQSERHVQESTRRGEREREKDRERQTNRQRGREKVHNFSVQDIVTWDPVTSYLNLVPSFLELVLHALTTMYLGTHSGEVAISDMECGRWGHIADVRGSGS